MSIEDAPPGAHENFNTEFLDGCPFISQDGKKFFMASSSTRPEGEGMTDIYVTRREKLDGGGS